MRLNDVNVLRSEKEGVYISKSKEKKGELELKEKRREM